MQIYNQTAYNPNMNERHRTQVLNAGTLHSNSINRNNSNRDENFTV